jgi:hypothetical protein
MIYMMFLFVLNKHTINVTNIMIMLFFWIKLNLKLPNFLTIQKCDRKFLSIGFAGMLKPTPFEGTHYKRWRQKCILWLTSLHYFHVVEERAVDPQTSEEERAFKHADTTYKAALVSIIGDSLVDAYVQLPTEKPCGMHLRPVTGFLMPILSCTSWSSFMTIGWLKVVR